MYCYNTVAHLPPSVRALGLSVATLIAGSWSKLSLKNSEADLA
jgi:hypothetical protein